MEGDTYKTINSLSEGLFKDKGSKFFSFAIPVKNTDEVKEFVKFYSKKFYDSRHVCYAYVLGAEREIFRSVDDGEPSGTAGKPILGQINSNELTDILIIVVRYFGGILLGTSGLINAYKEAALEAIQQAEIIEKIIERRVKLSFEYTLMNDVMRVVKDEGASVIEQQYNDNCLMTLGIRQTKADILTGKLEKIFGLSIIKD